MNQECNFVYEALNGASSFLEKNNREKSAANVLMQHVLNVDYTGLVIRMRDTLTDAQNMQFTRLIEQHIVGIPVQYLTNNEFFYGYEFYVDENVLIPRPETEELVEHTLQKITELFDHTTSLQLADIGTGSGAIAITMKKEMPALRVTATDLSEGALAVAKKNAASLEADIAFLQGDLTAPLATQKWDVVLSNPPYIAYDEQNVMDDTVIAHEPHTALFAEEDGYILYRKLAEQLPSLMNETFLIGLEIGYKQGPIVKAFFEEHFPYATTTIVQDLNGLDRMVFCQQKSK